VTPAVLIVSPAINSKGTRATSVRGLLFDAHLDGRLIVGRSTQPMLDGARRLLDEGYDPVRPLIMRRAGADHDALRSTIGAAAKLTVAEGERRPAFRPWKARETTALMSSMHRDEEGALSVAADESAPEGAAA
jgi:hypothetical protein